MSGSRMRIFTDAFKREEVRLVQSSGRTIGRIADNLGIGHSTLGKRLAKHRERTFWRGRTRIRERNWRGFARKTKSCGPNGIC
jgi:transposase-like protein